MPFAPLFDILSVLLYAWVAKMTVLGKYWRNEVRPYSPFLCPD
jgi:hypothetical protein